MGLLLLLFCLFVIYIFYSWYNKIKFINRYQLNGPLPIPLIGSYLSSLPFIDLYKLSKKYGDIFRIYAGDCYIVVLSDISIIKEMYLNTDNFNDRPSFPSMKYLSNYNGLVTSSGEYWKENRNIVLKSLSKIHLKQLYEMLELKIDQDITRYNQYCKSGISFNPKPEFIKFTTSLMFKYVCNQDIVDYNDPVIQDEIIIPTNQFFNKFGAIKVYDVIKLLRPLYELHLKYFESCGIKLFHFLNQKLDQHLNLIASSGSGSGDSNSSIDYGSNDLMDILIKEYGKDNTLSILSTCKDLMLGGIDTTATSIYHIVMLSCIYQDHQDKVYNELKSNIKSDKVFLNDKSSLPYTIAFIKECLRVLPVSGFPIPRLSKQDYLINGQYFIPKDAHILINFYALHHNEKYFENPFQFNPSRFLNPDSISNHAFIPFTIGVRSCVAKSFAFDQLFLYISNLLLQFKITSNNNINHSILNFNYGLTLKFKDTFNINLIKR